MPPQMLVIRGEIVLNLADLDMIWLTPPCNRHAYLSGKMLTGLCQEFNDRHKQYFNEILLKAKINAKKSIMNKMLTFQKATEY